MEDQNIDGVLPDEVITSNVPEVEQAVAAPEVVEESKPNTLRDAVLKAFEKTGSEPSEEVKAAEPSKEVDPITGREVEPIRAPNSMSPLLREKWDTVPRPMQKYFVERDRDIQVKLQESAEERKLAKDFQATAEPYQDLFRSSGISAVQHAKELFSMSHQLHTGTPQQKAQIIHKLMVDFKPDGDALTYLFNGGQMQAQTPAAPQVSLDELVNQRLAERQQAEQLSGIEKQIAEFANDPQFEFSEVLGEGMGKAIEAGFVTGSDFKTLYKNAYDFAANTHPEVKQVLANRAAASIPQTPVAAKASKPVQSVKPSLASNGRGGPSEVRPKSLREAAELAWNKHAGE